MNIKKGFIVRTVAGQSVVVATGEASKENNIMIRLNETGRFLWDGLVAGKDEDGLVSALLGEYEVDEATARADVKKFINNLVEAGAVEL